MATLFIEPGTDATQDFSFFSATNAASGTITSDNTVSRAGPRSIKSDITTGNGNAWAAADVVADAGRLISGWFYFSSVAPANATMFISLQNGAAGGGSTVMGVGLIGTGVLRLCGRGATAKDGSTVLVANTWYRISLGYKITSSSNWSATLYINGVQEVTTGNGDGNLGATGTASMRLGVALSAAVDSFGASPIITINMDSIYVDDRTDNSDCGNVYVTAKRPNANGTTNGFTTQIGAGGSGYGSGHSSQVNEQPLSTTNGWSMIGAGSAVVEEYNIEGRSTGDIDISTATIIDFMGWVYASSASAETAKIRVLNVDSNISLTGSAAMFKAIAGSTTYPAGGTDIGIVTGTDLTTVGLYECGIVIAYIPGSSQINNFMTTNTSFWGA